MLNGKNEIPQITAVVVAMVLFAIGQISENPKISSFTVVVGTVCLIVGWILHYKQSKF